MGGKTHLAETFVWSAGEDVDWAAMLARAIGMGMPILLAAHMERLPVGVAAAVGGLLAASARTGASLGEHARELASVLAAAGAAATTAVVIARHGGWTDAAMVCVASAAAVCGGYSRPLATGTGRFIVFLPIALSLVEVVTDRAGLLAAMAAGALWTAALALISGAVFRAAGWLASATAEGVSKATPLQKLRHWQRSLKHPAGWQYVMRLAPCLGIAGFLRWCWPGHHLLWIALTVAILCERQPESSPVKAAQRATGTMLGVAASGLLAAHALAGWALAGLVALLAGLGPWLRTRSYLAYTVAMTPLIILLLDAGQPIESGILIDRLAATGIGTALVMLANRLVARLIASKP